MKSCNMNLVSSGGVTILFVWNNGQIVPVQYYVLLSILYLYSIMPCCLYCTCIAIVLESRYPSDRLVKSDLMNSG